MHDAAVPTTERLGLAVSRAVAAAAVDGKSPVSIALTDPHGDLRYFHRMDGAAQRSVPTAIAKAYTAALWDRATGALKERLAKGGDQLAWFADPGFTALPGGLPIRRDGRLVAAVGISGRLSHEDEELAKIVVSVLEAEA